MERRLSKEDRNSIRRTLAYIKVKNGAEGGDYQAYRAASEGLTLAFDLDVADEEIENLHRQVENDSQLINTMACDAKQTRAEWQEMRSLLERIVDYVNEDRLSSDIIHELQELGILD